MRKPSARVRQRPDADRKLREMVFLALADAEIAPEAAIAAMAAHVEWIKTGRMPGEPKFRIVAGQQSGV